MNFKKTNKLYITRVRKLEKLSVTVLKSLPYLRKRENYFLRL
jgi:hypothetical protein